MADAHVLDEVRAVLASHKDELIRTYGAEGVGIGKGSSDDEYALVVYLADARDMPAEVSVEGVPVRFEVTGEFRALS